MTTSPRLRHPRKLREANPAAVPNILAGLNASIDEWNAQTWRDFTQSPETEFQFTPEDSGRPPFITLTRGSIEVRITLQPGFDIHRLASTILTPAVIRHINPDHVTRVQWRQALKGGGYVHYA